MFSLDYPICDSAEDQMDKKNSLPHKQYGRLFFRNFENSNNRGSEPDSGWPAIGSRELERRYEMPRRVAYTSRDH